MNIDEIKTKKLASFPTSEGSMNVKGVSCVRAQIFTQKKNGQKGSTQHNNKYEQEVMANSSNIKKGEM